MHAITTLDLSHRIHQAMQQITQQHLKRLLSVVFLLGASWVVTPIGQAAELVRPDHQPEHHLDHRLHAQLPIQTGTQFADTLQFTTQSLLADPATLHALFNHALLTEQTDALAELLPIYRQDPNADLGAADYANWRLQLTNNTAKANEDALLQLAARYADNTFIQLTTLDFLANNGRLLRAKKQLARAQQALLQQPLTTDKSTTDLTAALELRAKALADQLRARQKPQLSVQLSYITNGNVNDAPAEQTRGNWTFEAPKSAHGASFALGALLEKPLTDNVALVSDGAIFGKAYWDAKTYNDTTLHQSLGLRYSFYPRISQPKPTAQLSTKSNTANSAHDKTTTVYYSVAAAPTLARRFFGQDFYSHSTGAQLSLNRRAIFADKMGAIQQTQSTLMLAHDRANYANKALNGQHNHLILNHSISKIHQNSSQSLYFGARIDRETAQDPAKANRSASAFIGANFAKNHWELGANLNVGRVNYDAADIFNIRRRDHKTSANLSLAHQSLAIWGTKPTLVLNVDKTASNHFYYDKKTEKTAFIVFRWVQ